MSKKKATEVAFLEVSVSWYSYLSGPIKRPMRKRRRWRLWFFR
jgi:hypothetical protein